MGVVVDSVTGHAHCPIPAPRRPSPFPVVLYVAAVVFLQTLLFGVHRLRLRSRRSRSCSWPLATFTGQPVLVTGIVLALLIAAMFLISARAAAS